MKLTTTQKFIVEDRGHNILVSAGAGTGKTRVLVERFLSLVTSREALVTEILALTFTEKAATEMKSRILDHSHKREMNSVRRDFESAYISTFHSFASRLLKDHPIEAAVDPDFRVMEQDDADQLKALALDEAIEKELKENRDEIFMLLKTYHEEDLRSGIEKIYRTAKIEGKSVAGFLFHGHHEPSAHCHSERSEESQPEILHGVSPETLRFAQGDRSRRAHNDIQKLLEQLEEKELERECKDFISRPSWDWETVEAWKSWSQSFSRRGGKKDKPLWKELSELCDQALGMRLDELAVPWKIRIEKLAIVFEGIYQRLKEEEGCLDFDDLQIKALELFEKDKPANRKLRTRYQKQFKFMMVDEFQDTSPIQARLVELLASGNNLFYVGDFKQSIYGFRGTSPAHFLEKEKQYAQNSQGIRVPLLENFRTREPVLQWINQFFEHLWQEDGLPFEGLLARSSEPDLEIVSFPHVLGGNPDLGSPTKDFPPKDGSVRGIVADGDDRLNYPVTILTVELKDGEPVSRGRIREACAIADRIEGLHDALVPYGSIAILFQAMSSSAIYEQALKQRGIPFFVISGRGFYHQLEIKDMMNFLAFLNNPLADIPLAALLRSPLFQISDDTLVWLSTEAKKMGESQPLYDGVKRFELIEQILPDQKEKLAGFQKITQELLETKDRLYLSELLERILEATQYDVITLAGEQGVRRYANLKKLIDLAREQENYERMSLGDFIRFVRHLENQEVRESEAQIEAEKSGKVVRLMTIHAAKGLEFPVVFLADLAHESRSPESKTFLAQSGSGYAFQIYNEKTGEKEKPFSWSAIDEAIRRREKEEWKRLFYVAATRAKQRLYLSGAVKPRKIQKASFGQMACWMDWLTASQEKLEGLCRIEKISENFMPSPQPSPTRRGGIPSIPSEGMVRGDDSSPQEATQILARLAPLPSRPSRVIDLSVSAYSAYRKDPKDYVRTYELGIAESEKPEILLLGEEGDLSAAQFGTLMHRVLERLDFSHPQKKSERIIQEVFCGAEPFELEEAQHLLKQFQQSKIFHEIQSARRIFRELPFVLDERHGRIYGVIDLLYQTAQGDWCVVDYKTAEGSLGKVQASGYEIQLQMYAFAVAQLLHVIPKKGDLYFLKNQVSYTMSFDAKSLQEFRKEFQIMQESMLTCQE